MTFEVQQSTGNAPGFDLKIIDGHEAESEFTRLLFAGGGKVEVKSDVRSRTSNRLAIEYAQNVTAADPKGKPSGIQTSTADWWAIETYPGVWIVTPLEHLLMKARGQHGLDGPVKMGDNGNVGVLLPVGILVPTPEAVEIDRLGDGTVTGPRPSR